MRKQVLGMLAVLACVLAGMVGLSGTAMAKTVKSTGDWDGARYTVYDDGSAEAYGKVTSSTLHRFPVYDITSLDVTNLDTSDVTDLYVTFSNLSQCTTITGLNSVNDRGFPTYTKWNTSKVTSMSALFAYDDALTSLDLTGWDTSNVTDMGFNPDYSAGMFGYCSSLREIKGIGNWDVSKNTDFGNMFENCSSLHDIDGIGSWNTSNGTYFGSMFDNCSSLESLDLSGWDMSSAYCSPTFNGCTSLSRVVLGPRFRFVWPSWNSVSTVMLPNPPTTSPYTGKWKHAEIDVAYDGLFRGFYTDTRTSSDLASNWSSDMAGVYEWDDGAAADKYVLHFDANGGTGSVPGVIVSSDQELTYGQYGSVLPSDGFSRDGYRLDGWNCTPEPYSGVNNESIVDIIKNHSYDDLTINGNMVTLYASWQFDNYYSVTYFSNYDGDSLHYYDTFSLDGPDADYPNQLRDASNSWSRPGYTLVGWNTRPDGLGHSYSLGQVMAEPVWNENAGAPATIHTGVSLYAMWKANGYQVSFGPNGGVGSMSDVVAPLNVTWALPRATFVNVGHRFLSWNTKADGTGDSYLPNPAFNGTLTNPATGKAAVEGDHVTLYAIWQEMPTTAEYKGGMDVAIPANQQVTIENLPAGASYIVTETPIPSGWTLVRQQGTTGIIQPSIL